MLTGEHSSDSIRHLQPALRCGIRTRLQPSGQAGPSACEGASYGISMSRAHSNRANWPRHSLSGWDQLKQVKVSQHAGCTTAKYRPVVQLPCFLQTLDLANPHVAAALHIFGREPHRTICIVEFLRAVAGGPLGTERRQHGADLVAGHSIAALVRTAALQWENPATPQAGGEMFSLHR